MCSLNLVIITTHYIKNGLGWVELKDNAGRKIKFETIE